MEWNLDLLGDPIPEGFGKRGRPQHIPTTQNRSKVMLLLANGWNNERIAHALSITKPTLKKHYFRELRARDEARDRLDAMLLQRLADQVDKGNVGAMKELQRFLERSDMMIAHPVASARQDAATRQAKRGKKELALEAAQRPDPGTPLGELMARRMSDGEPTLQ